MHYLGGPSVFMEFHGDSGRFSSMSRQSSQLFLFPGFYPEVIIKIDEHFEEDLETFIEDYALDDVSEEAIERFTNELAALLPTETQVEDHIKQLGRQTLLELFEFYRVDLEMFGYSAKHFFEIV